MLDKSIDLDFPWESVVHPCYHFKILRSQGVVQFLTNKKLLKVFTLASFEKAVDSNSSNEIGVLLAVCRKRGIEAVKKVFRLKEVVKDG